MPKKETKPVGAGPSIDYIPHGCALWSVMRHMVEHHNANSRIIVSKCDSVDPHEKVQMRVTETERSYIIDIERPPGMKSKKNVRKNGCACFKYLRRWLGELRQ